MKAVRASDRTVDARAARKIGVRFIAVNIVALAVCATAVHTAVLRFQADQMVVWVWTPHRVYPDGFLEQVKHVKANVPAGAVLFCIQDEWDPWQFGLWRRALYPEHVLVSIPGAFIVNSADYQRLRMQHGIEYAISAGAKPPDPGFQWQRVLPEYPGGVRAVLGKLQ